MKCYYLVNGPTSVAVDVAFSPKCHSLAAASQPCPAGRKGSPCLSACVNCPRLHEWLALYTIPTVNKEIRQDVIVNQRQINSVLMKRGGVFAGALNPSIKTAGRPFGTTLLITPTLPRSSPDTAPNPTLNPRRRRQSLQPSLACFTRRSLCLSAAYTLRPRPHCLPYHPIAILCPSETLLHPVMGNNELTLPLSRLAKPCIAKRPIDLE